MGETTEQGEGPRFHLIEGGREMTFGNLVARARDIFLGRPDSPYRDESGEWVYHDPWKVSLEVVEKLDLDQRMNILRELCARRYVLEQDPDIDGGPINDVITWLIHAAVSESVYRDSAIDKTDDLRRRIMLESKAPSRPPDTDTIDP